MTTPWHQRYAQRLERMGSSTIRELLKLTQQADIISFAGGLPAPELFPIERFQAATQRLLAQNGREALQYVLTEGYLPLRQTIVAKMAQYGIRATPANVLITSGSQQALDLLGKVLLNPGDRVLVEEPTYLGALQAWRAYQADFLSVPVDEHGLRTDRLEEALWGGPKFLYVLPNFQNPSGVTLSLERRLALVDVAERTGIPIIEDDPYGQLRFSGEHLPPLVVLDAERGNGRPAAGNGQPAFRGNVIYLSTFSKTLAPGLRLGWIVAPAEVIERCVTAKQGMDLHTSSFVQQVAYEVIQRGFLEDHVRHIRDVYRQRRDLMLAAMRRHFPTGVTWTEPQGGLFLWVTVPAGIDTAALLPEAIAQKVAYVPGGSFFANGCGGRHLRLNFSNARPEQMTEGIRRLGRVLARAVRESITPAPLRAG